MEKFTNCSWEKCIRISHILYKLTPNDSLSYRFVIHWPSLLFKNPCHLKSLDVYCVHWIPFFDFLWMSELLKFLRAGCERFTCRMCWTAMMIELIRCELVCVKNVGTTGISFIDNSWSYTSCSRPVLTLKLCNLVISVTFIQFIMVLWRIWKYVS